MPKRIKPDIAPKKRESGHGSPSGFGATQILYVDTKKRVKLEPYNRLRSKCHNGKLGERYVITSGLTYPTCKTCKKVCDTVEIDPKKRVKKAPYITVLKDIPESICRTVPTSRPCPNENGRSCTYKNHFNCGHCGDIFPCWKCPTPEGCKGDQTLHVAYTNSPKPMQKAEKLRLFSHVFQWQIVLHRILLITLGVLLPIAYVKFAYNVHVTDIGDLILLRR